MPSPTTAFTSPVPLHASEAHRHSQCQYHHHRHHRVTAPPSKPSTTIRRRPSPTHIIWRTAPHSSSSTPAPVAAVESSSTPSISAEPWAPETHPLRLYNTLTRSKDQFTTIEPGVVRFYSCGPTVYDFAHVGNFRAILTYDLTKRWLLYRGYEVRHILNLTDVDDKIIKKVANKEHGFSSAKQLTDYFSDAFFEDLALLNVIPADVYPRATDHIDEMEEIVNGLKERGYAYESDGSTYFAVSKFAPYGKLAQLDRRASGSRTTEAANAVASGTRTDNDEYDDKEDLRDFALWKAYKEEDGDVYWTNSLGKGRPGWHIECTCMAMKYLGPELDIHGGGIDLVFPHHENEIAQSEALTDRPFARFWVHNGFVNVDNEKMSKSLGNFRTMRDVAKKPDDARAFRYLVVSSQYRSALAFTEQSLKSARSTVKRLDSLRGRLEEVIAAGEGNGVADNDDDASSVNEIVEKAMRDFRNAMDDDLNTPRATAAMFSMVNATEKKLKANIMSVAASREILRSLDDMDRVLGIFYTPKLGKDTESGQQGAGDEVEITPELAQLLEERKAAKKAKDFARADAIRDQVASAGFQIIDTPQGPKLQPVDQ